MFPTKTEQQRRKTTTSRLMTLKQTSTSRQTSPCVRGKKNICWMLDITGEGCEELMREMEGENQAAAEKKHK